MVQPIDTAIAKLKSASIAFADARETRKNHWKRFKRAKKALLRAARSYDASDTIIGDND